MPSRDLCHCAAVVGAALLLAACQPADDVVGGPGDASGATPSASTPGSAVGAVTPAPRPGTGEGGVAADGADAARASEPSDVVDVDVVERHPNGAVLQVRVVRLSPDAIEVGVEILNGHDGRIQLHAERPAGNRLYAVDDRGNEYPFSPPPDNETVEVAASESLEGTLVFLGRLDSEARTLTVHTYGGAGDQAAHVPFVDSSVTIPLEDR